MRCFVLVVVAATLMASAVGQVQTDPPGKTVQAPGGVAAVGRIRGVVVGGGTIRLRLLPDDKTVATTHADPKGTFEFRAVMPGRYLVSIEALGYTLRRFGVIVDPGKDVVLPEVAMERDLPCPLLTPSVPTLQPDQPIKTTLCEIMKDPERFSGRIVQFRASVYYGFEVSLLRDDTRTIWLDAGFSMTMTIPGGSKTPTLEIVLRKDAEYEKMARYLSAFYVGTDGATCEHCPLYKVTIDAVGLFEHVDQLTMGFGQQKRGIGFGHMNGYESRLVLQSVSNVEAAPINPSIYQGHL